MIAELKSVPAGFLDHRQQNQVGTFLSTAYPLIFQI